MIINKIKKFKRFGGSWTSFLIAILARDTLGDPLEFSPNFKKKAVFGGASV